MYVEGIGERNTIDTGGFPVVWLGDGIGQDPNQGGTNRYGPGDILYDADTGDVYQIGGDWAVRPLGSSTSSVAAPAEPAPSLVDHFFYVDSGRVIEKWHYSDGSDQYADTGQSSDYGDGVASGNMWDLVGSHAQQTAQTATGGSSSSGGYDQANPVGGYGPYATPDPPQLREIGQYVDGGTLYSHQVDQYGHDYYTPLGPAPAQPATRAPAAAQAPAPIVQRPAGIAAPNVSRPAQTAIYTATATSSPIPAAVTQARAVAPATVYQTANGPRTLEQMESELRGIGWPGPVAGADRAQSAIAAYTTATGRPVTLATTSTSSPTRSSSTPAITATGNPSQFLQGAVGWLTRSDWIGGVPNALVVAGGFAGYRMLSRRRRR